MERKGQGTKVPGSELARVLLADSLRGANWPGSEKARYPCRSGCLIHNGTYLMLSLTLTITLTLTVTVRVTLTLLTLILDTVVNKAPTSAG